MLIDTNIREICTLIFQISAKLREKLKEKRENDKCDEISFLNVRTLLFVQENTEPTMKDIADFLAITPPSATSLIDHYVKLGQLERILDKNDRRIVRLKITSQGKQILKNGFKNMMVVFKDILSNLDKNQINEVKIILKILAHQE